MQIIFRFILCLGIFFGSNSLFAGGIDKIQEASKENKHLFIFFYKDLNEKTLALQDIFDKAMLKIGEQATKVKANDPSEQAIIQKFNLKTAPMPFVLVLAPNGAITGGFPSFNEQQLIDSLSSPGAASCLKALQERKLVFLCLQNNQTANNEAALNGVKEFKADARFSQATEIVVIDPTNASEHKFLNQLSLDTHPSQATTVLISPPAEIIGTYKGLVTKNQLVTDVQNASSGCCGPGGCCPGGKCGRR